MGLDVAVVAAENLFESVAGEILRNIHKLAPAVIALARKSLRVFVGEMRTRRRHHRGRNDIFAGDQLDVGVLPGLLGCNDLKNLGFHGGSSFFLWGLRAIRPAARV